MPEAIAGSPVNSDTTLPARIVAFAKTQLGIPYHYGCAAPSTGFDCSGFINYVYHHFNIEVPRSSVDFTNYGTTVPLEHSRPSDLILFTGTNSRVRTVGHIGIVVANDSSGVSFIHASSGKEEAVIVTRMNDRYKARFVKVVRIVD
jgi:cell wall-associated NlpC family hydrolase